MHKSFYNIQRFREMFEVIVICHIFSEHTTMAFVQFLFTLAGNCQAWLEVIMEFLSLLHGFKFRIVLLKLITSKARNPILPCYITYNLVGERLEIVHSPSIFCEVNASRDLQSTHLISLYILATLPLQSLQKLNNNWLAIDIVINGMNPSKP